MQSAVATIPSLGIIIYSAAHTESEQITIRPILQEKKQRQCSLKRKTKWSSFVHCIIHNTENGNKTIKTCNFKRLPSPAVDNRRGHLSHESVILILSWCSEQKNGLLYISSLLRVRHGNRQTFWPVLFTFWYFVKVHQIMERFLRQAKGLMVRKRELPSQGARPNKRWFRSTHPTEKVWQLILIDQYLLFKIRYYVVPNCGTPDEINGALYHDMALSIETRLKQKLTSNFIFFR